jgi:flagellar basal-body rod protein FlgB
MNLAEPTLPALEAYLKLAEAREQTIARNMANIDTPGYHTRDIDFESEFHKAIAASSRGTEVSGGIFRSTPASFEVSDLLERPDGNNVSMDRESMLLAEAQLQQQIGVQLIKHQFHGLLSVINAGGQ